MKIAPRAARACNHSTASTNRRGSGPVRPGSHSRPRQCGEIVAHWASVKTVRIKVASHVGNSESVIARFGNPQTSTRPKLNRSAGCWRTGSFGLIALRRPRSTLGVKSRLEVVQGGTCTALGQAAGWHPFRASDCLARSMDHRSRRSTTRAPGQVATAMSHRC